MSEGTYIWNWMNATVSEGDTHRQENLLELIRSIRFTEMEYEDILKKNTNNKYSDTEFLPTMKIEESNPELFNGVTWERIEDHYPNDVFTNISADAICQGTIGDCYLIAALVFIAQQPELVRQIFKDVDYKRGCACIYFHSFGKKIPIIIDTLVPFKFGKPTFASARTKEDSAWFLLIERAFAKVSGSYTGMENGQSHVALFWLLGWFPQTIKPKDFCGSKKEQDTLWNFLYEWHKNGCMLCCSAHVKNSNYSQEQYDAKNLKTEHAYVVLDVREIQNYRFLRVRNPWGNYEWSGDWSDKSPLWTPSLKKALNYVDSDDGAFWMIYKDFIDYYTEIYISQPPFDDWTEQSFEIKLEPGDLDGRHPKNTLVKPGLLPQWLITFKSKGHIHISIEKIGPNVQHHIVLQKNNGRKIDNVEFPFCNYGTNAQIDGVEWEITEIDQPWTILVTRDKAPTPSYVRITIHTEMPSTLSRIEDPDISKLNVGSGKVVFYPGDTDNRYPFMRNGIYRYLTILQQWTVKFTRPSRVYIRYTKSGAKVNHNIFFNKRGGKKIDFVLQGEKYKEFKIVGDTTHDFITWDIDEVDEPWTLCFCRSEASDKTSQIVFDFASETPFKFLEIPQPDSNIFHHYQIKGTLVPGWTDGVSPYKLNTMECLQQYSIKFTRPTYLVGYLRVTDPDHNHSIHFQKGASPIDHYLVGGPPYFDCKLGKGETLDQFGHQFDDVNEPWAFVVTREAAETASQYSVDLYCVDDVNVQPIPLPDYAGMHCYKIKGCLKPGMTDNRTPYGEERMPNVLQQYKLKFRSPGTLYFICGRDESDTSLNVLLENIEGELISRFTTSTQNHCLPLYKGVMKKPMKVEIQDVSKAWSLCVCRQNGTDKQTNYELEIYYKEAIDVEPIRFPPFSSMNHYCITGIINPGKLDDKDAYDDSKTPHELPQWVFDVPEATDIYFTFRVKDSDSLHTIGIQPFYNEQKITRWKVGSENFGTYGLGGLDQWKWRIDATDKKRWILVVYRSKSANQTKWQLDIYCQTNLRIKEFDGREVQICTQKHDNDFEEPPKISYKAPPAAKFAQSNVPQVKHEKPGTYKNDASFREELKPKERLKLGTVVKYKSRDVITPRSSRRRIQSVPVKPPPPPEPESETESSDEIPEINIKPSKPEPIRPAPHKPDTPKKRSSKAHTPEPISVESDSDDIPTIPVKPSGRKHHKHHRHHKGKSPRKNDGEEKKKSKCCNLL